MRELLIPPVGSERSDGVAHIQTFYTKGCDGKWITDEDAEVCKLDTKVIDITFYEQQGYDSGIYSKIQLSRETILFLANEIKRLESVETPDGQPSIHDDYESYIKSDLPF